MHILLFGSVQRAPMGVPYRMLKTAVFRFTYFDRQVRETRASADFATLVAIAAIGAIAVKGSEVLVDSRLIGAAGLVLEERMPVTEDTSAGN